MLDDAPRDMGDGAYIQSRQSADLFNVAHFRAKTKTTRILMRELLFADDNALVAHSAEEMQNIVDAFSNRPISLTLVISKLLEHIIHSHIIKHLEQHHIVTDHQYGFREKRFTETQFNLSMT